MKMKLILTALISFSCATTAAAAPKVNEQYVRSLAVPGKNVLVIEYYDAGGNVTERKGYAAKNGYRALSGTDFQVDKSTSLHLYGLEPCDGDMTNRLEEFSGTCDEYAKGQLQIGLNDPKVLFCKAFLTEKAKAVQDATCYGYYYYPQALDSVSNLEEQLLSIGGLRLKKNPDGTYLRPELLGDQEIGRKGRYGMWADPRVQAQ